MLVQITREDDYKGPRSITAPTKEIREEYEAYCQSCGLCCCHPLTRADELGGMATGLSQDSVSRLTYYAIHELTYRWWHGYEETQTEEGYWMRMKDGHCIALEGELGKQVSCTIYPDRPSTCRQFEAGSEACLHLREKLKT